MTDIEWANTERGTNSVKLNYTNTEQRDRRNVKTGKTNKPPKKGGGYILRRQQASPLLMVSYSLLHGPPASRRGVTSRAGTADYDETLGRSCDRHLKSAIIHSQLNWATLLCEGKLSILLSFHRQQRRPQNCPLWPSFTQNCAVHSGNPTVSSVYLPTPRWHHLWHIRF